jgi:hypothetical protein
LAAYVVRSWRAILEVHRRLVIGGLAHSYALAYDSIQGVVSVASNYVRDIEIYEDATGRSPVADELV